MLYSINIFLNDKDHIQKEVRELIMEREHGHFANILLPAETPFLNYSIVGARGLGRLSTINIFIGTNNSGKSRLLRALFVKEKFGFSTEKYSPEIFRNFLAQNVSPEFTRIMDSFKNFGPIKPDDVMNFINTDADFIFPENPIDKAIEKFLVSIQKNATSGVQVNWKAGAPTINSQVYLNQAQNALDNLGISASVEFQKIKSKAKIIGEQRYYIPILRGMRPLDDAQENFYHARTMKDYFSKTGSALTDKMHVFTGIELYQTLKAKLLGEPEDRESVKEFENYLSRKFFGSQSITLIPREGDTTVYIKIGKDKQLAIYELGDGLQSLIICSFNIFMEKTPCLFFIEEPDICMHPSMQRAFLEMLLEHKQHQYFLTTHSNHLLDMTMDFDDISVFHFTKKNETGDFQITATSTRDHNLLRDLGVRNSSVFLTNATIWVEGITDRLYLRAYMKKYCEELKENGNISKSEELRKLLEDFHYTFVEYQGAPLTHWNFDSDGGDVKKINAAFLCANALLIADGDILGKGDREETFREMLGSKFVPLSVKEIENLLPVEILQQVVKDKFAEKSISLDSIEYDKYAKPTVKLGEYLDKKLKLPAGETIYKAESGTVKSKMAFCEKSIEAMSDSAINWKLTAELVQLCETIFKHIVDENK